MGQEAECTVRWGRRTLRGRALLESTELLFRGDERLKLPFAAMRSIEAQDGVLRVTTDQGAAAFTLGPLAQKWADRIRNPKSVIDKLGVKPGHVVSLVGLDDPAFAAQVRERTGVVSEGRAKAGSDLVFLGATTVTALKRLPALEKTIARNGGVWVVWPKGRRELTEDHVRAAAKQAGLTDVKVVAFSPTHSALKLVIPLARR